MPRHHSPDIEIDRRPWLHADAPTDASPPAGVTITLDWRGYLRLVVPVIVALSVLGALALYSTFVLGHGSVYGVVPMFLLNAETNVPTFFSAANLLFGSVLLLLAATAARQSQHRFVGAWVLLGLAVLFMAVDEAAGIHELLDRNPQWAGGGFSGADSPWVIAYGMLVLGFVAVFARFFLHLPLRYRGLLALAAGVFVGASIGLETIGAAMLTTTGITLSYEVVNALEEVLEMSAVALANASLLSYLQAMHGPLSIRTG